MPVKPGERAAETGTFHCRDCDGSVRVKKGERLPKCPCGSSAYTMRTKEPRKRTATRQRKSVRKRAKAGARRAA